MSAPNITVLIASNVAVITDEQFPSVRFSQLIIICFSCSVAFKSLFLKYNGNQVKGLKQKTKLVIQSNIIHLFIFVKFFSFLMGCRLQMHLLTYHINLSMNLYVFESTQQV